MYLNELEILIEILGISLEALLLSSVTQNITRKTLKKKKKPLKEFRIGTLNETIKTLNVR